MDYDPKIGKIVLFGGSDLHGHSLNDTWTFDGSAWDEQHPSTKPPRAFSTDMAAMAYDPAIGKTVLFGGPLNDTWTFDGSAWVKQNPLARPPRMFGEDMVAMAYDYAIGKMVLIRGNDYPRGVFQTWTYDGTVWKEQAPIGPPCADCLIARLAPAMAYDRATRKVVLFGGEVAREGPQNETWAYDGTKWKKQTPTNSPPPRSGASMVYDAAARKLVLFGGDPKRNDTWTYNGVTWTRTSPTSTPPPRERAAIAYDPSTNTIVLFGGATWHPNHLFGDTWTYKP